MHVDELNKRLKRRGVVFVKDTRTGFLRTLVEIENKPVPDHPLFGNFRYCGRLLKCPTGEEEWVFVGYLREPYHPTNRLCLTCGKMERGPEIANRCICF